MKPSIEKNTMAYIYVVGYNETGPVKIGFTADPNKRLAQLQTAQPNKLKFFHTECVDAYKAPLLEKLIHKTNRHNRIKGEWFNLTAEQAKAEVIMSVIQWGDTITPLNSKYIV